MRSPEPGRWNGRRLRYPGARIAPSVTYRSRGLTSARRAARMCREITAGVVGEFPDRAPSISPFGVEERGETFGHWRCVVRRGMWGLGLSLMLVAATPAAAEEGDFTIGI